MSCLTTKIQTKTNREQLARSVIIYNHYHADGIAAAYAHIDGRIYRLTTASMNRLYALAEEARTVATADILYF